MLYNYFITALRALQRNKVFSFINITGLSLGITGVMLIMLYVQDELRYDQHHRHAKAIYRVVQEQRFANGIQHLATTSGPLAKALAETIPEIQDATRLLVRRNSLLRTGDQQFTEEVIAFADANLFDVFSFDMVEGNPKNALAEPNSIVLSQSSAEKLFPGKNPMGKTLQLNNTTTYTITGILRDPPSQSHFRFDALASLSTLAKPGNWLENRGISGVWTYVRTVPGVNEQVLDQKLVSFVRQFRGDEAGKEDDFGQVLFHLQPLLNIHLHSDMVAEIQPNGDARLVLLFSGVAVLILLLACANYVILATATYIKRLKEVGLRKTLGAHQSQLAFQFWLESAGVTMLSFGLSLVWIIACLPLFNQLTAKELALENLTGIQEIGGVLLVLVVISVLASAYPAWYVSRYRVMDVFRNSFAFKGSESGFRNGLIIFQFVISISLLIATVVVYQQLIYIENKPLGFQKEYLINLKVRNQPNRTGKMEVLKQELRKLPGVRNVAASLNPVGQELDVSDVRLPNTPIQDTRILRISAVDHDFVETLGLSMAAGRNFSREFANDTVRAFIINEAAVRQFGWQSPEEAIGKELEYLGGLREAREPIIGVVHDFHFASLHQEVQPLLIMCWPSMTYSLNVRVQPGTISQTLTQLEQAWYSVFPDYPFEYSFADQTLAAYYQSEQRTQQIFTIFAALAISIACLGLFGLSAFTAQQKIKEIGIRKVLGASVTDIVVLLSTGFLRLVLLAFVIAIPLAWYAMSQWLNNFAYRISMQWWIFALVGLLALIIALLTLSWQSIKAALANPVDSLRSE